MATSVVIGNIDRFDLYVAKVKISGGDAIQ